MSYGIDDWLEAAYEDRNPEPPDDGDDCYYDSECDDD
jgi:hypothetical protein